MRDAEERSAGLPLTLDIPPCPKRTRRKPETRSVPSLLVRTPLHVGAAVSYCVIRFIGRPDKPRFNALSSNAVKIKSSKTSRIASEQRHNPTVAGVFNHQFRGGRVRELKQDVAMRGCSRNVLRTFLCAPRSPRENSCIMIAHSSSLLSIIDNTIDNFHFSSLT